MSDDPAAPRRLCNVHQVTAAAGAGGTGGAAWRLDAEPRGVDANIVRLPAGRRIDTHDGPDLDVVMLVLDGHGEVVGADAPVPAEPGALIWLPRRSRRSIVAGDDGLTYLTVHPHRPGLTIGGPRE
jgi:quercetin dioxygenase-like cupin family protein